MFIRRLFAISYMVGMGLGCSAQPNLKVPSTPEDAAEPPVLSRSLFSKDGTGSLSESDLQTILTSPIDLDFPARVGVVPLAEPFDPGADATIAIRSVASEHFAKKLRGSAYFSHVSDISTELPNVGGMEGLRAIAARYRLRYLLLYSERFEDDSHANGWAALYPTIIGIFLSPGVTVESHGLAQADLIDVRTGTVLFSSVVPMHVESIELPLNADRAQREGEVEAASVAAKTLAGKVQQQVTALLEFADEHKKDTRIVRILPAPVQLHVPGDASELPAPVGSTGPETAAAEEPAPNDNSGEGG